MNERTAFLKAICDEPREDAHRLVYADWLEEYGEGERAEFIRVQVALSFPTLGPDGTGDSGERYRLVRRERELYLCVVRSFVDDILDPHTHCRVVDVNTAQYDSAPGNRNPQNGSIIATANRGFLSAVRLRQDDFLKRAASIFASHPVTSVALSDRNPLAFEGRFLWHNADHRLTSSDYDGDARPSDHIAGVLFDRLDGFIPRPGRVTEMVKGYDTRAAAVAALSRVCVPHGREVASLPALVPVAGTGAVEVAGE